MKRLLWDDSLYLKYKSVYVTDIVEAVHVALWDYLSCYVNKCVNGFANYYEVSRRNQYLLIRLVKSMVKLHCCYDSL